MKLLVLWQKNSLPIFWNVFSFGIYYMFNVVPLCNSCNIYKWYNNAILQLIFLKNKFINSS